MATAKTTDPVKVAATMEGMKFKSFNGEVEMRKSDHQLQQGLHQPHPAHVPVVVLGLVHGSGGAWMQQTLAQVELQRRHRHTGGLGQIADAHG